MASGAADRVKILGVPVDRIGMTEAVERVDGFIRSWTGERTRVIVTPNPEIVIAARGDRGLRESLAGADLAVADGAGIVWAARRLGFPVPERIPGIDLMEELLALAAGRGYRVFFLGTRPEVLAGAVEAVRDRYPGLDVAGSHHGYFAPEEEGRIVARIREARPHLLFTGMGSPRDQVWSWKYRHDLGAAVAIGVGGGFDVMAGVVRRAPPWVRSLNMEWFFRLMTQPRRWRRMLVLPRFAFAILRAQ